MSKNESGMDTRRLAILNHAASLLASKPTASMAEIAAAAQIGKATLHRYFTTREALLTEVAYRALEEVSQAIQASRLEEGTVSEALLRLNERLVPMGDKIYFLLNDHIWDVNPDLVAADEAIQGPVIALIERGQASGELRPNIPIVWVMYTLNYVLYAAWQGVYEGAIAPRDAPHLVVDTILKGIAR